MAEFTNDLLREAIADAEQVRETAIANAKLQLEETIAPTIKAEITRALSQSETEVEEAHDPQRGARAQDFAEVGEGVEASDEVEDDASDVEIVNEDEVSEETEEISEEVEEDETAEPVDEIEITVRGATTTVSGSELNAPHIREEEEDEEGEEDVEDVDDEEAEEDEDLEDLDLEAIIRELQREVDALGDDDDDDEEEEEVPPMEDDEDEEEVEEGDEEEEDEEDEEEDDEDEVEEGTEDLDLDAILREIEAELSDEDDTELAQENTKLQGELDEYRKAVELLRGKLNEVNLLNAKLLFTNKLFKGKELSQEQKIHVVETFDLAMTIREVKLLYATLAEATINVPAKKKQTTSSTKVIAEGIASKVVGGTAPAPEVIEEDQFAGFRNRMKQLAGINEIL